MLEEVLNYTQKADEIIISILEKNHLLEANRLFSHVLNAQNVWARRMLGQKPDFGVWQSSEVSDFRSIAESNFKLIWEAFKKIPLDTEIIYSNSKGDRFSNKAQEILLHLANHSTYHRGQIAAMLRKAGIEPPSTDYIIIKRSNQL